MKLKLIGFKIFPFFLILILNIPGYGNSEDTIKLRKNSVYAELLGNGILYSINYERIIIQKNKSHFSGRIGVGSFGFFGMLGVLPIEMNYFRGSKHFFEMGIGATFTDDNNRPYFFRLGYRFQKPTGRFLFRAGILPTLWYDTNYPGEFEPSITLGVSFGYAF